MTVLTEILTAINASPKFHEVESILNGFGITINKVTKKTEQRVNLKTSHKFAKMINLDSSLAFNFDFLTFKDCKIETKYPVNEVLQKVINYGNQYVDFFEALRIQDLLTHKLYNYAESVKPYIDFDFSRDNPDDHEIVLNFEHTKSSMCQLISNTSTITSGSHQSMYIVFNLSGEMKVNRVNISRKRTIEAWEDDTNKSYKEYGMLTEMIRI